MVPAFLLFSGSKAVNPGGLGAGPQRRHESLRILLCSGIIGFYYVGINTVQVGLPSYQLLALITRSIYHLQKRPLELIQ